MKRRNNEVIAARERLLEGVGAPVSNDFVADEFQSEAIQLAGEEQDVLVVAPTGAGKTFVAVQAIRNSLALNGKCVYTTPLKALSNTKYNDFKRDFEPEYSVGILTGDRKIEGDADLVVATTEIYRNELYRYEERYSLVILDEVHFIADEQRGPVWEESIILTPKTSTLLMLSASVSNSREVANWISEVRGKECKIVQKTERPVELRLAFLHPDHGVIPLREENGEIFPPVSDYYGSVQLDDSGRKLVGGKFSRGRRSSNYRGKGGNRSGGRGRNGRGKGGRGNSGRGKGGKKRGK